MSALKSIQLALEVATLRRDEVGKKLAGAVQTHTSSLEQLDQLQSYAADTDVRWTSAARISATPELMRHHYQFMDRLHQAMNMQDGVISDLGNQVELARKALLQAEFRLNSLKQIMKKKQAELLIIQGRREQKQTDEMATMKFVRSAARNSMGEMT